MLIQGRPLGIYPLLECVVFQSGRGVGTPHSPHTRLVHGQRACLRFSFQFQTYQLTLLQDRSKAESRTQLYGNGPCAPRHLDQRALIAKASCAKVRQGQGQQSGKACHYIGRVHRRFLNTAPARAPLRKGVSQRRLQTDSEACSSLLRTDPQGIGP